MPPNTLPSQAPALPQATSQGPAAYMQTKVHYMGATVFSGGLALLEWGGDNHIRLFIINPATNKPEKTVFECLPQDISKAKVSLTVLVLYIHGKSYRLDTSLSMIPWMETESLLGMYMANREVKESSVAWWADSLKAQGVTVSILKFGGVSKGVRLTLLGITGAVVLLILLAIALTS